MIQAQSHWFLIDMAEILAQYGYVQQKTERYFDLCFIFFINILICEQNCLQYPCSSALLYPVLRFYSYLLRYALLSVDYRRKYFITDTIIKLYYLNADTTVVHFVLYKRYC